MHKIKWFEWLLIPALAFCLIAFVVNFSPYNADESLNFLAILIAFSLFTLWVFSTLRMFCLLLGFETANKIAFTLGFVVIQFFLISTGDFLNLNSVLLIIFFNGFIIWCTLKVL